MKQKKRTVMSVSTENEKNETNEIDETNKTDEADKTDNQRTNEKMQFVIDINSCQGSGSGSGWRIRTDAVVG